jgi:uncharacterized protein YoxC
MAKPRVFVSSTYYDLKHVRASLETFISDLGYEPILFENGDIPFHHDKPLDQSCYDAVEHAHIFVLLIGGRYGSSASGQTKLPTQVNQPTVGEVEARYKFYNSITVEEYRRARTQDLPIYIFLEKGVGAEYQTFKENREVKIKWAHVDNVGVFHLLDEIFSQTRNNVVKEFDSFGQISSWLRDQWAGLMADFLSKKKTDTVLTDLTTQVETLNQVVDALKSYSEAIVKKVETDPAKSAGLIQQVEKKLASEIVLSNPFIRYLSGRQYIAFGSPENINKIIDASIHSGSLDEFLSRIGIPPEKIVPIREQVNEPATRDLLILRKKLAELTEFESAFKNAPPFVKADVKIRTPVKSRIVVRGPRQQVDTKTVKKAPAKRIVVKKPPQ